MPEFWGLAARSSQLDPSHPSANLELLSVAHRSATWSSTKQTRPVRQPFPTAQPAARSLAAGGPLPVWR